MRNKFLVSSLAIAVLSSSAVQLSADPISHLVTLNANVESACSIAGSASFSGGFQDATNTASTFEVDMNGSSALATEGHLSIGTITCTGGQVPVTISRTQFIKNADDPTMEIPYSVYFKEGDTVYDDGSSLNGVSPSATTTKTFDKMSATVGIRINTAAISDLAVGDYVSTLNISIDPS